MYKPIQVIIRENYTKNLLELSGDLLVLSIFAVRNMYTHPTHQSHQSSTEYSQTAHSEHICVRLTTQDFSVFPVVGCEMVVIVHKRS